MKNCLLILLFASFVLAVGSCKKEPLNANQVIYFADANAVNWPADNLTTLPLTVIIPTGSDPQTQVIFTTDLGTFLNSNSNTITVSANANGQAIAYIKSAAIGTATVKATVQTTYSATKTIHFNTPNADSIFTIGPYTDSIMADGASTMIFKAAINKNLPAAGQSVTLTADNGATFSNGNATVTVNADGTGNATAYLKTSTIGPVHVVLSDGNVTRNLTVNFVVSLPDYMLLNAQPSLASGFGNSLPIKITLMKNIGKPSLGFLFNCTAVDNIGNSIGVFSNQTASDMNGSATVNFTTGNSTYKGMVRITIAVQQDLSVNASINVLIN
jgi:hypothetical protein